MTAIIGDKLLEEWNILVYRNRVGESHYEHVMTLKRLRVHNREELHGYMKQIAYANRDMRANFKFVSEKVQNVRARVREDLDRPNNASGPAQ